MAIMPVLPWQSSVALCGADEQLLPWMGNSERNGRGATSSSKERMEGEREGKGFEEVARQLYHL